MKTFYLLRHEILNGLVPIKVNNCIFVSKDLRNKVIGKLNKVNENNTSGFFNKYKIEDVVLYEDESEVPILNDVN